MTKRVAWFTGEPSIDGCFTPHKVYEVVQEEPTNFSVINDKGTKNFFLKKGCAYICHGNWTFADIVEEKAKMEEVDRKGVMTLLTKDSKFEIGQRVRVDRSGYVGYTTIIGYNYNNKEYATECDSDNGCHHDCEGLAGVKGRGLWVVEADVKPATTKQPKWSAWIENTTGKCPEGLKRKQKIKLKWDDGDKFVIDNPQDASWYFSKGKSAVNITHYKVKLKSQSLGKQEKPKSKWTMNTGVMPVDGDVAVMMKFYDGTVEIAQAREYNWDLGQSRNIVKWRLAE